MEWECPTWLEGVLLGADHGDHDLVPWLAAAGAGVADGAGAGQHGRGRGARGGLLLHDGRDLSVQLRVQHAVHTHTGGILHQYLVGTPCLLPFYDINRLIKNPIFCVQYHPQTTQFEISLI